MKKLLVLALLSIPVVACSSTNNSQQASSSGTPAPSNTAPTEQPPSEEPPAEEPPAEEPKPTAPLTADNCLDGQDMDAADVDVSKCPAIPSSPASAPMAGKEKISLGAWEIGTAANGATWVYGTLSKPGNGPRVLSYDGGEVEVNDLNVECWAKGYYRLRKMLQTPPAEYVALKKAGFQYRFFQFQSDLRNGSTGFKKLTSFEDHLVKWVTVISKDGVCQQPTATSFKEYAKAELTRRGIAQPTE